MDIPATVRQLLWEYQVPAAPAGAAWERAIIEKVMLRGRWDDMRWLLQCFSRDMLGDYLERRGCRALAPRELRFWALVCGVPASTSDAWVALARRREQAWRG
ncbi:MAG: hypothetical protein V1750_05610 [Acidobacteriota bacterium]